MKNIFVSKEKFVLVKLSRHKNKYELCKTNFLETFINKLTSVCLSLLPIKAYYL